MKIHHALATVLGLTESDKHSPLLLARELVNQGYMSGLMPKGHPLSKSCHVSNYVNKEVVIDLKVLRANIQFWVDEHCKTLDDLEQNSTLARLLGLPESEKQSTLPLARELVSQGYMSGLMPKGHPLGKAGGISNYVNNAVIVDQKVLRANIQSWVDEQYHTLDDVKQNIALAKVLGLTESDKHSPPLLAKELVRQGYISGLMPKGHPLGMSGGVSNYVNKAVIVDQVVLRANIQSWVDEHYQTLDDVKIHRALATVLGLPESEKGSNLPLARALVSQGYLSGEINLDGKLKNLKNYFDARVVGIELAKKNIQRYLQTTYADIFNISRRFQYTPIICLTLDIPTNDFSVFKNKIIELGWFETNFRSYANSKLPNEFMLERKVKPANSSKTKKLIEKEIGSGVRVNSSKSTTFLKGEALEQLVGVILSYQNPKDLVIPQYCLQVDSKNGFFGVRADYKVGDTIYEVKWGMATSNIEETVAKHKKLMPEGFQYKLLMFAENDEVDIPHEQVENMLSGLVIEDNMQTCLLELLTSVDDKNTLYLEFFRDYIYSTLDEANHLNGLERQKFLEERLQMLRDCPIDERIEFFRNNIRNHFASLEAHFDFEGQLYRGFISPQALQKEQSYRYEMVHTFDGYEFSHQIDRDILVMLELSNVHEKASSTLPKGKTSFRHLLFSLPNGPKISSNGHTEAQKIEELDDLRNYVLIDDEHFAFGVDWIRNFGSQC